MKIKYIIFTVLLALLLTGCQQPKKDVYTLKEIYSDGAYGFFVKDGDRFFPVTFLDDSHDYFQWYTGERYIPKVTSKTPLVAVFGTSGDMPDEYYIKKYNDLGYTVGANIRIGEDDMTLYLDTSSMCAGSHLRASMEGQDFDSEVELESINDVKPYSNIDTDINILTGLEKNKYYDLSIYSGTQSMNATICADTRVLKFVEYTDLIDPLEKTHEQYFVVNLPTNLHKGFYDINGEGMFQL